jgi:hypothetical protein
MDLNEEFEELIDTVRSDIDKGNQLIYLEKKEIPEIDPENKIDLKTLRADRNLLREFMDNPSYKSDAISYSNEITDLIKENDEFIDNNRTSEELD